MRLKNIIVPVILLVALLVAGCEKGDEYADWKRINEEWLEANNNRAESFPFEWSVDVLKTPIIEQEFETTESGIKYKALRLGNPTDKQVNITSEIIVAYEGKLIDGSHFDKSEKASFSVSGTAAGFMEILLKMKIGDIYEFYLPYETAYGEKGQGKVPPYSVLTFRVELQDAIN